MKKLKKDVLGLGTVGIGIGIGSSIAAGVGHGGEAFSAMGGMMGPVSVGVMGGNALRLTKKHLKWNTK